MDSRSVLAAFANRAGREFFGEHMKHIYRVEMAHKLYGANYTSYNVTAHSAKDAITAAEKKATDKDEYAFEVKHVITLD